MRVVVVDKKKCTAGEGCNYVCMKYCPKNRGEEDCIIKDDINEKINIIEESCIGCGICVKKCPFDAIKIINLPEELKTTEIHNYGTNKFRLFNLIIPQKNQVIGLVGVNGIGKSTCLNILSGEIKPNLGKLDNKFNGQDVIDFFKGTEGQEYFENLYTKQILTSIKPQYIEKIPKLIKGTVKELLNQITKDIDVIVKKMDLTYILNRNIKDISGGELQRVAIAVSLLKKSDFLFIDEPSSYLDIKQRLKIANLIREESKKKKCSIIIEHDLIMLDYLCDVGHIIYGRSGAYGIVSRSLSIRECINTYLEGYIKEDNMRFRNNEIKFEVKAPNKSLAKKTLIEWNEITKKLGDFKLKINKGKLHYNEIIGIVGENGTGKTTFARILAGELTPTTGKINENIKISYKPQYIQITEKNDSFVFPLLMKCPKSILKKLNINHLLKRKLSELSGGELQRVAIAECLGKEADIYLLDEPSAHLDVEQRLNVAKIIRDIIKKKEASCLIIDHDILFMDYLSDKLLVFSGDSGKYGESIGPLEMKEGMNIFLENLGITFRRDKDSKRPRANKLNSQKDSEQKRKKEYYYQ